MSKFWGISQEPCSLTPKPHGLYGLSKTRGLLTLFEIPDVKPVKILGYS